VRPLQKTQKVFGIGLSKTGTLSLSKALNVLGIPAIHFPHDQDTFAELQRGDYRLSVLRGYQGITDTPVAPFYAQLDTEWPGSKFILTVRGKDSWLESVRDHWRILKKDGKRANDVEFQRFVDFINACVYGCVYFNAERFSYAYDAHNRNVRKYFAGRPDDLLVLDICGGEGWGELCGFLGVPFPADKPFPHAHRNPWLEVATKTKSDLAEVVSERDILILVDQECLRDYLGVGRPILPFMERDGMFRGLPQDDASAVEELERLRLERGATILAVGSPSLWTLDYYAGFTAHVRSRYECVLANEHLVVFRLE
jgi:Sulfotransferase domain